jgi:uncharacterized membrane protein YeaQ/YmgE (transglycosylase-associated protein family)
VAGTRLPDIRLVRCPARCAPHKRGRLVKATRLIVGVIHRARIERALTNRSPECVLVDYTDTYLRAGRSMSTVVFFLIGMAACGFTRGLFNTTLGGFLLDLCLGVIGAVAAGSLFNYYIGVKIAQLYIASGLIAISGAALLLAACHAALWVVGYCQLDGRRVRIAGMGPLPFVPGAGRP